MAIRRITLSVAELKVSSRNVRRSGPGDVSELAASIASVGLIHPLKVVAATVARGKITHEIVAGSRRFAAVRRLIKSRALPKDYGLRCEVVSEKEAEEISLAENIERADMHPADEFEAFLSLVDKGATVATVAAKFGVAESVVSKRLKLARVAPDIMSAFRVDQINLDQIMAYAVTDDQVRQSEAFSTLPVSTPAWKIKQALTEGHIPTSDKRLHYIGIDVYRSAGAIAMPTCSATASMMAISPTCCCSTVLSRKNWTWRGARSPAKVGAGQNARQVPSITPRIQSGCIPSQLPCRLMTRRN